MKKLVYGRAVVEWVAARTGEYGNFGAAEGIGVERDGKLIGGAVVNDYNGVSAQMHVASEEVAWMTPEFLWMLFDYAFNQLKLKTVISLVGEKNHKAIALGLKLGFEQKFEIPDAHPEGTLLIRTMTRDRCKWLELGRRYEKRHKLAA